MLTYLSVTLFNEISCRDACQELTLVAGHRFSSRAGMAEFENEQKRIIPYRCSFILSSDSTLGR